MLYNFFLLENESRELIRRSIKGVEGEQYPLPENNFMLSQ